MVQSMCVSHPRMSGQLSSEGKPPHRRRTRRHQSCLVEAMLPITSHAGSYKVKKKKHGFLGCWLSMISHQHPHTYICQGGGGVTHSGKYEEDLYLLLNKERESEKKRKSREAKQWNAKKCSHRSMDQGRAGRRRSSRLIRWGENKRLWTRP